MLYSEKRGLLRFLFDLGEDTKILAVNVIQTPSVESAVASGEWYNIGEVFQSRVETGAEHYRTILGCIG